LLRLPSLLRTSIAAKLVLGYGLLGIASIAAVSAVFYSGTIGVLDQNIDGKIGADGAPAAAGGDGGRAALQAEVGRQLGDGIDSDREIFQLLDEYGAPVAGNLGSWPAIDNARRDGAPWCCATAISAPARLYLRPLSGGEHADRRPRPERRRRGARSDLARAAGRRLRFADAHHRRRACCSGAASRHGWARFGARRRRSKRAT
jgi:hypothetical protein